MDYTWIGTLILFIIILVLIILLYLGFLTPQINPNPVITPVIPSQFTTWIDLQPGPTGPSNQCNIYTFDPSLSISYNPEILALGELSSPNNYPCLLPNQLPVQQLVHTCNADICYGYDGTVYTKGQKEIFFDTCPFISPQSGNFPTSYCTSTPSGNGVFQGWIVTNFIQGTGPTGTTQPQPLSHLGLCINNGQITIDNVILSTDNIIQFNAFPFRTTYNSTANNVYFTDYTGLNRLGLSIGTGLSVNNPVIFSGGLSDNWVYITQLNVPEVTLGTYNGLSIVNPPIIITDRLVYQNGSLILSPNNVVTFIQQNYTLTPILMPYINTIPPGILFTDSPVISTTINQEEIWRRDPSTQTPDTLLGYAYPYLTPTDRLNWVNFLTYLQSTSLPTLTSNLITIILSAESSGTIGAVDNALYIIFSDNYTISYDSSYNTNWLYKDYLSLDFLSRENIALILYRVEVPVEPVIIDGSTITINQWVINSVRQSFYNTVQVPPPNSGPNSPLAIPSILADVRIYQIALTSFIDMPIQNSL